jgi:hypothetical protein
VRAVIEHHVSGEPFDPDGAGIDIPASFKKKSGVFVTINTSPERILRGCIGFPEPVFPLIDALQDAAKSACNDPRFPPLTSDELERIVVEVSILTFPEFIRANEPSDYLNEIKVGRDGLIVEMGIYRGLLLPQVPVEWKWGKEEFLSQTCLKAGLMPHAWQDRGIKIYKFQAHVFAEKEPRGGVQEVQINK